MASLTFEQARDEVQGAFYSAWQAHASAVAGGVEPDVEWQDVEGAKHPDGAPWARVVVKHTGGGQRTMGEAGGRRFGRRGIATVQVFAPRAQGVTLASRLCKIVADAFEGQHTPNGVQFSGVAPKDVGFTGPWYQMNVVAEFAYDEIK